MSDFNDKVVIFSSEMENVAQKIDLRILEKYLAMWNPRNVCHKKKRIKRIS
jgi:hypothetical protein